MVALAALTVFAIVAGAPWINRNRMLDDRIAQMRAALERQKNRMQRIAEGSLDEAVEEMGRRDEIGRTAETLEVLRQTAITAGALEAEQVAIKQRGEK